VDQLVKTLSIGPYTIGARRCFVIAEAGVNHNGSIENAHALVDVAADAGADAVKFQIFTPERLVSVSAPKAEYQIASTGGTESQLEMLEQLTLTQAGFAELSEHSAERGIVFLCTAFDEENADFLTDLGVVAFKVPSGEITNHPFLAHLARKGKPLLVSTGMSTLAEVRDAVDVIGKHGSPPFGLFHCVSQYPAPVDECNLNAMATMRDAFGVPVGWSDHTLGIGVSVAAVAAGADLIEKHFTVSRDLPGPDHAASLEPAELTQLVKEIREVEAALGGGEKVPASSETSNIRLVRRSLHASRRLPSGHVLEASDCIALRPATGISPTKLEELLGRRVTRDIEKGQLLEFRDLK
jgi:N,N'-diacetyllegionaminate synthase